MTRINIALLILLLASSVYLVRVSYESRRLFAELDQARAEERLLANEQQRLLALAEEVFAWAKSIITSPSA